MNHKSKSTFNKYGSDLIGRNLKEFHGERAWSMIKEMIVSGNSNHYTIEKGGIKKIIHQEPYFNNGNIAGVIEFSFEIPFDLPNFVR